MFQCYLLMLMFKRRKEVQEEHVAIQQVQRPPKCYIKKKKGSITNIPGIFTSKREKEFVESGDLEIAIPENAGLFGKKENKITTGIFAIRISTQKAILEKGEYQQESVCESFRAWRGRRACGLAADLLHRLPAIDGVSLSALRPFYKYQNR